MSDPSLALQNAVEAALRGSTALAQAMGGKVRLYPLAAPADAPFPYLTIGEDQIIGDETECSASSEAYTTTHVWARVDGDVSESRAQAKRIGAVVRSTISRRLNVVGFEVTECEFRTARHLTDPDRRTAHTVIEHRLLLDPA